MTDPPDLNNHRDFLLDRSIVIAIAGCAAAGYTVVLIFIAINDAATSNFRFA